MTKFSYLTAIPYSFFSKDLYQDVAKQWQGFGFLYLFILLAICWLPIMYLLQVTLNNYADNIAPKYVQQIPTIKITDGEASIQEPVPYYIIDPDTNQKMGIIDTSGQYKNLDNNTAQALLTKHEFFLRVEPKQIETYDLRDIKNYTITKEKINSIITSIKHWGIFLYYPLSLVISFIYRIIELVIYAAIGLFIFAKSMKIDLDYATIIRLAAVAITPSIIIATVLQFFYIIFAYQNFIYSIIALIYLFYAIRSNLDFKNQEGITV